MSNPRTTSTLIIVFSDQFRVTNDCLSREGVKPYKRWEGIPMKTRLTVLVDRVFWYRSCLEFLRIWTIRSGHRRRCSLGVECEHWVPLTGWVVRGVVPYPYSLKTRALVSDSGRKGLSFHDNTSTGSSKVRKHFWTLVSVVLSFRLRRSWHTRQSGSGGNSPEGSTTWMVTELFDGFYM